MAWRLTNCELWEAVPSTCIDRPLFSVLFTGPTNADVLIGVPLISLQTVPVGSLGYFSE